MFKIMKSVDGANDIVDVYDAEYVTGGHVFKCARFANARMPREEAIKLANEREWIFV